MVESSAPSLRILAKTLFRKVRIVPPNATICVTPGTQVNPEDIVARAEVPGQIHSICAADKLGIANACLMENIDVRLGDVVSKNQIIGRRQSVFGLFRREVRSPVSGRVENISKALGHVMIRQSPMLVEVCAYIGGTVESVDNAKGVTICAHGSLVQGAFGIGNEVVSTLCHMNEQSIAGKIVCCFGSITDETVRTLREQGVLGVIASSIEGQALLRLCGQSVNLAATGDEDIGIALILTEGFGDLPMGRKTKMVLEKCIAQQVSICGTTQVRAGAIRPEIIGPPIDGIDVEASLLNMGSIVKIIRGPYLGQEAKIIEIPPAPCTFDSGVTAFAYRVKLINTQQIVLVPRPNVE